MGVDGVTGGHEAEFCFRCCVRMGTKQRALCSVVRGDARMGQRRMGKRRMGGGRTGVCSGQVTSFSISRWPHCGGDLGEAVFPHCGDPNGVTEKV